MMNWPLLNQINAALASSLELDEILNKTLALLIAHFKVEAGEIFLLEEDGDTLRLVLHRGEAAEAFWTHNRYKFGEGMVGQAAETKEPVVSNHLEDDQRVTRQAVVEAGFKQIACIPLTAHGEVVGVLTIATRSRQVIPKNELQLLISVGAVAGTAIENARLHTNARRVAVLKERERFGMDLHDGVIQSIYGVGLALENARALMREDPQSAEINLKKAMEDLNRTIRDIRNYILDLRPRQLPRRKPDRRTDPLDQRIPPKYKGGNQPGGAQGSPGGPASGQCHGLIPYLPGSPGQYRQACQCEKSDYRPVDHL